MTTKVEKIAEQVKALPDDEREEFLSWLADFEVGHSNDWDKEISCDSRPGARLERVLGRVRKDIAEGRTKPLDEVLHNSLKGDEATFLNADGTRKGACPLLCPPFRRVVTFRVPLW